MLTYLRILALEKLGAVFNQVAYNLDFTPRKFVVHAESGKLFLAKTFSAAEGEISAVLCQPSLLISTSFSLYLPIKSLT